MALLLIFTKQIECVADVAGSVLLSIGFCILPAEEHGAVLTLFHVLL